MDKSSPSCRPATDIDLEKANSTFGESPHSPNSQLTWGSQDQTVNSSNLERIVIEEDSDEESGKS